MNDPYRLSCWPISVARTAGDNGGWVPVVSFGADGADGPWSVADTEGRSGWTEPTPLVPLMAPIVMGSVPARTFVKTDSMQASGVPT
jgi:hypothetical protein